MAQNTCNKKRSTSPCVAGTQLNTGRSMQWNPLSLQLALCDFPSVGFNWHPWKSFCHCLLRSCCATQRIERSQYKTVVFQRHKFSWKQQNLFWSCWSEVTVLALQTRNKPAIKRTGRSGCKKRHIFSRRVSWGSACWEEKSEVCLGYQTRENARVWIQNQFTCWDDMSWRLPQCRKGETSSESKVNCVLGKWGTGGMHWPTKAWMFLQICMSPDTQALLTRDNNCDGVCLPERICTTASCGFWRDT